MEDPPDEPTTSTSSFNKRTSDAAELDDCSNPLPNDRPSSSSSSGDHHNSKMARLASDATEASMELVETTLDEEMEVNVEVKGKGKERAAEGDSVLSPILKQAKLPEQEADMGVSDAVSRMADDIEQELWCGLCAAILHKPVLLMPCSHAVCGSCCSLYLSSSSPSPSTCPSCRTTVTSALFSRTLSNLVDIVVCHAPSKARIQSEVDQADEVWDIGEPLKFSAPPPPPVAIRPSEAYRPCPHCHPGHVSGFQCPVPVPTGIDALSLDGPCPEGHFICRCSRLAAVGAPSSASCSICEDGSCGTVSSGCTLSTLAASLPTQEFGRTNLDLADAIMDGGNDDLCIAFHDNSEEMRIFSNWIATQTEVTTQVVWEEILAWLETDEAKQSGGVRGMLRRVDEGIHSNLQPGVEVVRACRSCVEDIFACALFEWWLRRRPIALAAGQIEEAAARKPDCAFGRACHRQGISVHVKKFNHVCSALPSDVLETIQQDDDPLPPLPTAPVEAEVPDSQAVAAPLLPDGDPGSPPALVPNPPENDPSSAHSPPPVSIEEAQGALDSFFPNNPNPQPIPPDSSQSSSHTTSTDPQSPLASPPPRTSTFLSGTVSDLVQSSSPSSRRPSPFVADSPDILAVEADAHFFDLSNFSLPSSPPHLPSSPPNGSPIIPSLSSEADLHVLDEGLASHAPSPQSELCMLGMSEESSSMSGSLEQKVLSMGPEGAGDDAERLRLSEEGDETLVAEGTEISRKDQMVTLDVDGDEEEPEADAPLSDSAEGALGERSVCSGGIECA